MLDTDIQNSLAKNRTQTEIKRLMWQSRLFATVSVILALCLVFLIPAYLKLSDNFMNNTRVAWVKIAPSGDSSLEYLDDSGQADRYHERGVNASLMRYARHRFAKQEATISYDYAVAAAYLGPSERAKFLKDYDAPKVAAEFAVCEKCEQVEIEIRGINHDNLIAPTEKRAAVFVTTIYLTRKTMSKAGILLSSTPQLLKLRWKLSPIGDVKKNFAILQANPFGIEILHQEIQDEIVALQNENAEGNNR